MRPTDDIIFTLGGTLRSFDDQIVRVPEHTLDFGITYAADLFKRRDLLISAFGRQAYRIFDGTGANRVRLPDYFVADLKLVYRATDHIRPFVQVDNVTDEDFQTFAGIPMPGIGASVGVTLEL